MKTLVQSLWRNYGFRDNPFDTSALCNYQDSILPIKDAFIARGHDCQASNMVNNLLSSQGGCRFVLEGEVGVGKTTFINYYKYIWENEAKDRLFTPISEISFGRSWNIGNFMLNILSSVVAKLLLLKGEKFITGHPFFKDIMILSQVYAPKHYQIEANLFGFGGSIGKNQEISIPDIPVAKLFEYYRNMVIAIRSLGYQGIILHFDNLELINKKNIKEVHDIFEDIRDILQVRYIYYIFVSSPGFFQQVIAPLPRVRSVFFGWPISLRPLSKEETLQMIHLRYQLLSIPEFQYIKPVEDSFLEFLYDVYDGQVRFIMDAVNAIVIKRFTIPRTLTKEEARPLFRSIVLEKMKGILAAKELELLHLVVNQNQFTITELSKISKMQVQNTSKYVQSMIEKGYVRFLEKQGRNSFYCVTEDAKSLKILQETSPQQLQPVSEKKENSLNERQKRFLASSLASISLSDYSAKYEISMPTARRDLAGMEVLGFLKKSRQGKTLIYYVL